MRIAPAIIVLRPRIRILSWAGLTMLACFSATRAEAACGDYVHVGGMRIGSAHATTGVHERSTPSPAPERLPCSGPQCRGERPFPVPAPAVPAGSVSLKWCCATPADFTAVLSCGTFVRIDTTVAPIGIPSDIFRPPR